MDTIGFIDIDPLHPLEIGTVHTRLLFTDHSSNSSPDQIRFAPKFSRRGIMNIQELDRLKDSHRDALSQVSNPNVLLYSQLS
jgi:hypothetical protein